MSGSVKNVVYQHQPEATEATIRQTSRSKSRESITWIVVEGKDDVDLYGKMYDDMFVKVYPSTDENGIENCENVECIVKNILSSKCTPYIIGIRDKDYTPFTGHSIPENVFVTDYRDIEMQIIESKEKTIDRFIADSIKNEVIDYTKQNGLYRIFNDRENLGFNFDNVRKSDYWNLQNKKLNGSWKHNLEKFFFEHQQSSKGVTKMKKEYEAMVTQLKLNNKKYYDICQGHEFVDLLKSMGISEFDHLDKDLFRWYSKTDYKKTQLAKNIENWATRYSRRL